MTKEIDRKEENISRRKFVTTAGMATAALTAAELTTGSILPSSLLSAAEKSSSGDGVISREKTIAPMENPSMFDGALQWPQLEGSEEANLLKVLKSGKWCRSGGVMVDSFEKAYAAMNGAKFAIATNSGTSALNSAVAALNYGPYDEIITTPYTFIATLNCILNAYALPVLVDLDPQTFLIDPKKIPVAVTENTAGCIPVHIAGSPVDMAPILSLAGKRNFPVIEDACQAHLGQWNGKKLGSIGDIGCFSFQVTKNLACGDGGAVITSNEEYAKKLYAAQNNSRERTGSLNSGYLCCRGANLRMTEFQGAVLCAQIRRIERDAEIRNRNALYLQSLLAQIPGIYPATFAKNGRSAWHLFMFRVEKEEFGMSRDQLLGALNIRGLACSSGYSAQDWCKYIRGVYDTRAGRKIYSKKFLDDWQDRTDLPVYRKICSEAGWFGQTQLLGPKSDMDKIADIFRSIQKKRS